MGELVNLRRFRKSRVRDAEAAQAETNRVAFGRTRNERDLTKAERDLAERRLDSHRILDDQPSREQATGPDGD
jgi:hypothetical protein